MIEEEDDIMNAKITVALGAVKNFAVKSLWPLLKASKPYLRKVVDEDLMPAIGKVVKDKKALDLIKEVIDDVVDAI
jgi:spore coat protein CotF